MNRNLCATAVAHKKIVNPCFGCEERKGGCHGSCETYKEYREKFSEVKEEARLQIKNINLADDYTSEAIKKTKKKNREMKKRMNT